MDMNMVIGLGVGFLVALVLIIIGLTNRLKGTNSKLEVYGEHHPTEDSSGWERPISYNLSDFGNDKRK